MENPQTPETETNPTKSPKKINTKRIVIGLIIGLLLCTGGLWVWLCNPTMSKGKTPSSPIPASAKLIKKHVYALTHTKGYRNHRDLKALNEAGAYIKKQFTSYGLKASEQRYKIGKNEYKNILASAGPKAGARIVIGAHYDVYSEQMGADDNASGVAGMLEIARLVQKLKPKLKYGIDFVGYTLEEPPYFRSQKMGSAIHANSLAKANAKVKVMYSIEMIGYFTDKPNTQEFPIAFLKLFYPTTGNFITVVGNQSSTGRALTRHTKRFMRAVTELPTESINAPSALPGIDFSDHLNYWANGYPAIMITDTAFYRNHNYHKKTDTPEKLDYPKMAEVVKGVYWAVVNIR